MTWVLHGPEAGLAQAARDLGFDVFMGNFRGNYPRQRAEWVNNKTYWDGIGLHEYAH